MLLVYDLQAGLWCQSSWYRGTVVPVVICYKMKWVQCDISGAAVAQW